MHITQSFYASMGATAEVPHLLSENKVEPFKTKPSNKGPLWMRWTHYVMKKKGEKKKTLNKFLR